MKEVTIPIERYDQLIRAEQDANILKGLLSAKVADFSGMDLAEIRVLHKAYCEVAE